MSGERLNHMGVWNRQKGICKRLGRWGKWPLTLTGRGEPREAVISEEGVICLPCHLLTGA